MTLGIGAISAVELFLDRKHRDAVRAAGRRSEDAVAHLDRSQRRDVSRAVRSGRAVADPQLAPAAVAMSAAIIAGKQRPWRWVTSVIFIAWLSAPAVAASVEGRWLLATALWLGPVLFLGLIAFRIVLGRRARDAFEANGQLVDRTWPPDQSVKP
ncbi:MAG: hypothetical protein ACR2KK_18100 [Acidimicrobiales bacterium]